MALTDTIFSLKKKQEKEIKKVIAYYKGVNSTRIDSLLIPYSDTAALLKLEDSLSKKCIEVINFYLQNGIILPRKVEQTNPWFRFAGTIKKDGLLIDSLTIPDTLQLRFVEKGGFLKKRKVAVQFFHSNPYISTTQSNTAYYKPKKKPRLLEKLVLVGAGIFLGSKL